MTDHPEVESKTVFGFWIYLWTDFMLFATFFATYAVLNNGMSPGPTVRQACHLSLAFAQTLLLLFASFASGLGGIAARHQDRKRTLLYFGLTFLLGAAFMGLEIYELCRLVSEGNGWQKSAVLSAFFSLVGIHGLHVLFGLLWTLVFLWPVFCGGISDVSVRRLTCLRMFWQFLNLIWVFIFAIAYLSGGF